jgi:hypothetical protein
MKLSYKSLFPAVIPAKAGIPSLRHEELDARLRGHDNERMTSGTASIIPPIIAGRVFGLVRQTSLCVF